VKGELPGPGLSHAIGGFASLVDKTARAKLTYRFSTFMAFIANGLGYAVFLLVWLEVYRQNPAGGVLPRRVMIPYLVGAFVLNAVLTLSVELRFMQRLRQGLITADLVRPMGFLGVQMAQAVGDVLVNLVLAAPLVIVAALVLGRDILPERGHDVALAVASAGLAFVVNFGVSYLIVQATFVLQSGYGVLFTRVALHQAFSGLAAPLVAFPAPLRAVAVWLPFRHVIETPVLLWLGQESPAEALRLLFAQAAWAVALLAGGAGLFEAALRRHEIQGG
jgi:ABC-2 type transport system permease protein